MKIITLTLNPAFDVHCKTEMFSSHKENIVTLTSRETGGKGINISRALNSFGVENTAIVVIGEENGKEFSDMLCRDSLSFLTVSCEGRIRENITIHDENKTETRISFGGFSADNSLIDKLKTTIGIPNPDMIITLTGSIPSGIETEKLLAVLKEYENEGARIVIDSRSVSLEELIAFKPWLIKPNKDEAENYLGKRINTPRDAATAASALFAKGIKNVIISLGSEGAVIATREGNWYAKAPRADVLSTIGAGDSAVAGFIDGFLRGLPVSDCLKNAVAFGTAACIREGTAPPLLADVEHFRDEIAIFRF